MHHSPVGFAAADIAYEAGDDFLPARGVRHFGVKLNTIKRFRVMRYGSIGGGLRMTDDMKVWRWRGELIPVRHPHLKKPSSAAGLRIDV